MNTTTAEYLVSVRTDEGTLSIFRTMPTRPKTQKGIKSQNDKLEKWAMKQYPNWQEIKIIPAFEATQMNYTLKQLQDRVNKLIEQQGEDAYCAAWIYTAEDCVMYDENEEPQYPAHNDRELSERIFNDVGNIDYIYTVIQECVNESTEEQFMGIQQEMV